MNAPELPQWLREYEEWGDGIPELLIGGIQGSGKSNLVGAEMPVGWNKREIDR